MSESARSESARSAITPGAATLTVDARLLEILVCPLTQSLLEYDSQAKELISRKARLAYPLRDGVPIMLPGEAREIAE